ncbi:hypothetical protein DAEQUDRAFT_732853 [Daedalea quercina L-15889]|uniref:Stealth protein CR3 conserved region 3 domain-containing protein n=1 Tax=Daedalea quercina L-15889 TaxID=1314783 RepID=A0A165LCR9_9APHY|nr:hypothetical protein DAEQUDRAFT_732853 [Daedalea quercina L-15889]
MRLSVPHLTIPRPRPDSAIYLPLTPWATTPTKSFTEYTSSLLRRRGTFFILFAPALALLFLVIRFYVGDWDDLELDYDTVVSLHTSYMPFQVFPEDAPPPPTLRPHSDPLPSQCIDAHFTQGALCSAPGLPKFDFIWTWVNGSDVLEQQAKKAATQSYDSKDPWRPSTAGTPDRMFRDHDELRHSFRSVLAAFRDHLNRILLLTSDFPVPFPSLAPSASWRLSQLPQWLDLAKQTRSGWKDGDVVLDIIHHSEIFRPYLGTNFNSLAIESQLGHVQGISDHFIYMNDDLFFGVPLQPATFYTPAYGIVLHFDPGLMAPPERPDKFIKGEWRGIGESNYMLSQRFGVRHRPYVMHEAKVVSTPILAELELTWPAEFARSASHLFRETAGPGTPSDINTLFLHAHFIVERAREALLWSWVVGKIGGVDDQWGLDEQRRAWAEVSAVGIGAGGADVIVKAGHRYTVERERVETALRESGLQGGLGKTSYVFSSLDGYAYAGLGAGASSFQRLTPDVPEGDLPTCTINFDECLAGYSRASDVFKHIAFEDPKCGDCVIRALSRASGPLGVAAFLPPQDRRLADLSAKIPGFADPSVLQGYIPHLPLVSRYQDGDFSLRSVMGATGERDVRTWTMQVLQRYRYVVGSTPAMFEMLLHTDQVKAMLQHVDETTDAALICINDDVVKGHEQNVAPLFKEWQERRWPTPAEWERE